MSRVTIRERLEKLNPQIEVPKEFHDELDKKSKQELIALVIRLSWEIQELDKAVMESENAKRIVVPD